jgi:hypothetical protein
MKDHLDRIRQLLDELEQQTPSDLDAAVEEFSAMELPLILQEIVDDLQPLLTPYEAAFYWYLFRHSIGASGTQIVRQGTRGLQTAAVKPYRSEQFASGVSLQTVRNTLSGLETIGAIRKEGEPNRDGTPYRVLVPDEIEACRKFRAERTATEPNPTLPQPILTTTTCARTESRSMSETVTNAATARNN